jgi:hypothetical protein
MFRFFLYCVATALLCALTTTLASAQGFDESGAQRFLSDPGELVTLYGSRRYGPLYEPGRAPPPTDPDTGWPVDWSVGPYSLVGGPYYATYGYSYRPYGYYRSFYRPWYVPYGYGYGWGYRYPFGYSWYANRWSYYRRWAAYGLYRPWYDTAYAQPSPYLDYGPSILNEGIIVTPGGDYGGCFYW